MKFWTTQTEDVIDIILSKGVYNPDFSLSNGLGSQNMKPCYYELLNEYYCRNKIKSKGLIFGITKLDDVYVENIKDYKKYFLKNWIFSRSVSNFGENYAILEIEIPNKIDNIPIYFQDFIIMAQRKSGISEFKSFVKKELENIQFQDFKADLAIAQSIGWTAESKEGVDGTILNKIVQSHIHQIPIEYIKGVYGTVDFENQKKFNLGNNALKLKKYIDSKNSII